MRDWYGTSWWVQNLTMLSFILNQSDVLWIILLYIVTWLCWFSRKYMNFSTVGTAWGWKGPKFQLCGCCAVYNIVLFWTAIYRKSIFLQVHGINISAHCELLWSSILYQSIKATRDMVSYQRGVRLMLHLCSCYGLCIMFFWICNYIHHYVWDEIT